MAERKKLGELLLEAKLISDTQLQSALAHQRQWGVKLGTALLEKGFVDEETLGKFLTLQRGMPHVVVGKLKIAPEILKRIPRELQEKHVLIPIAVEKAGNRETLVIAMADPNNLQALDEIRFAIGSAKIRMVIAAEVAIKKAIAGDTRQFRPSLGAPPPQEAPRGETTDEFQIVRGTMETGAGPRVQAPPPVAPASATRTPARGVASAPIGEAVLDLDLDLESSEPAQLDASALEPIITNVGPPPSARPAVATPPPAVSDPFLDALRGPPRQSPARAQPAPAASASTAAASAQLWSEPSVAEPSVARGVSPFEPDPEDRTERDIQAPPRTPTLPPTPAMPVESAPPRKPTLPPMSVESEMPVESAPPRKPTMPPMPVESFADTVVPVPAPAPAAWESTGVEAAWPESSSETPFEPMAEAAPWPSTSTGDSADTEPGGIPAAVSEASDLGPGAVPVVAAGMSPLEASVPEISLPGPEMPDGWRGDTRVGAFDPDTAPETDLGAIAGASLFAIPSELEVQEGSIPGEDGISPSIPEPPFDERAEGERRAGSPPGGRTADHGRMDPESPPAEWNAEPGLEATAADELMDPSFLAETAISAEPEMAVESMAVESMMPPETPASVRDGATAPEFAVESMDPPMEALAVEAPYSSSAGAVPVMTALESQQENNPEATAIGAGHHEPTWDAPMEFTAPPEGSAVADLAPPPPGPATNIRPDIDEDRNSVTRESPFPHGAEATRGPAILSPLHVEESAAVEPKAAPQVPPEVTPPTRQSAVPGPTVRVPGEVPPAEPERTPSHAAAVPDVSATGPVASMTSEEQTALNVLISKKLKLLNAITEILLEKGLITEDEIKEKIAKKKH